MAKIGKVEYTVNEQDINWIYKRKLGSFKRIKPDTPKSIFQQILEEYNKKQEERDNEKSLL